MPLIYQVPFTPDDSTPVRDRQDRDRALAREAGALLYWPGYKDPARPATVNRSAPGVTQLCGTADTALCAPPTPRSARAWLRLHALLLFLVSIVALFNFVPFALAVYLAPFTPRILLVYTIGGLLSGVALVVIVFAVSWPCCGKVRAGDADIDTFTRVGDTRCFVDFVHNFLLLKPKADLPDEVCEVDLCCPESTSSCVGCCFTLSECLGGIVLMPCSQGPKVATGWLWLATLLLLISTFFFSQQLVPFAQVMTAVTLTGDTWDLSSDSLATEPLLLAPSPGDLQVEYWPGRMWTAREDANASRWIGIDAAFVMGESTVCEPADASAPEGGYVCGTACVRPLLGLQPERVAAHAFERVPAWSGCFLLSLSNSTAPLDTASGLCGVAADAGEAGMRDMGFQFVPQVNTGRYPLLGAVQPWARYGGTIECVRRLAFLGNGAGDPHGMSIEEPTLLLRSPLTFGYTFASGNLTANATEGAMRAAMRAADLVSEPAPPLTLMGNLEPVEVGASDAALVVHVPLSEYCYDGVAPACYSTFVRLWPLLALSGVIGLWVVAVLVGCLCLRPPFLRVEGAREPAVVEVVATDRA